MTELFAFLFVFAVGGFVGGMSLFWAAKLMFKRDDVVVQVLNSALKMRPWLRSELATPTPRSWKPSEQVQSFFTKEGRMTCTVCSRKEECCHSISLFQHCPDCSKDTTDDSPKSDL